MSSPVRRTAAAVALALALGVGAGACSGADDPGEPAAESPRGTFGPAVERAVPTRVSLGQVTGRMDRQARQRLMREVTDVVDGWTEAAYLGGSYPRRGSANAWADAWPGFTRGARDQARRDRALMSNQDIGDRIDGVTPRRSVLVLDVLAAQGRPVGVTARVRLGFRTTGDLERTVRVTGRLFLTRTDGQWQVFGYDVSKGMVQ
ncbi:hypothetical protein GCM10027062_05500 [Nocardioides hungaricus]